MKSGVPAPPAQPAPARPHQAAARTSAPKQPAALRPTESHCRPGSELLTEAPRYRGLGATVGRLNRAAKIQVPTAAGYPSVPAASCGKFCGFLPEIPSKKPRFLLLSACGQFLIQGVSPLFINGNVCVAAILLVRRAHPVDLGLRAGNGRFPQSAMNDLVTKISQSN